jgi:beta-lactamase regulating signal transducer with metallopeptidase domain
MNAMQLLTGPAAQAIGWALLHLLWQATIVAGILAAVLALLPRQSANARYAVSCGALALVFAMFVTTAIGSYDPGAAPIVAPKHVMQTTDTEAIPLMKIPVVIAATAAESWRDRALDAVATARQSLPTIVAVWFLGVVLLSSRLLLSWLRARNLITHGTQPAGIEWQRTAARLSEALGLTRAVKILESAVVEVPSVLGSLRPVILLPASTLTGLTPAQIEMVLAHELAHIRRHDFLVNLLQAFVETLMFYHPAVWWMSRRVRIERENCCDDLAVAVCGDRVQYAKALTRLEELRATALPVVVAANGGSLLDRIRRIASSRPEATGVSARWTAAAMMLALLVLALALPSASALAQREEKAQEQQNPQPDVQPAPQPSSTEVVEVVEEAEEEDYDFEVVDVDVEIPDAPDAPDAPEIPAVPHIDMHVAIPPVPPVPPVPAGRHAALAHIDIARAADLDFDFDHEIDVDVDSDDDRKSNRKLSEAGKLTVDELISLRAVGVTPEYITTMKGYFPDLTIREVTSLKAVGVTPEYIQEMRGAGFDVKTPRDATSLKAVGVTPEYVREMRVAGFDVKTARAATSLHAVGVTPRYVREMRDAGMTINSERDVTSLKAVGVTAEWLAGMRSAGVAVTSARDASSMKAVGVTPQFVQKLANAGYANLSVRELTRLAAVGIDDDFIREMEQYRKKK